MPSKAKKAALIASASNVAVVTSAPVKAAAKPAKPDASAARAERVELFAANRAEAQRFYDGASSVIHSSKPGSATAYAAVCDKPVHKIGANGPTTRDDSLLAVLMLESNSKTFAFDPVKLGCDLGAISRAASVKRIAHAAGVFTLTPAGRERANVLLNRKA